ncbi:MAG: putative signal transducing protein [Bacteroidales bacterium]
MFDNWVAIFCTNQLYEAEMAKDMLSDNNIECVIMNKQDSTYHFGEIELLVPFANVLKAKQLILEFKSE